MGAERSEDDIAALDGIFASIDHSGAPGLIVGIARHGRPIYRRGFGLASVRHGVANEPTTRIRIASTSKQFTCLAILLLAEDGQVDIDAPADRYLEGLPRAHGVPTLRHLMTHTSGYRCSLEMGTIANGVAAQPTRWQTQAMLRQSDVHFAPNQGQMYCNGTYVLLAEVIDRHSGMPFEAFLKTRIFEPLGMHDTDSVADDTVMVPSCASLHVPAQGGGWRLPPSDAPLRGDGGVISTVDDMLRWIAHLNGPKRVGNAETWRTMLAPAVLDNGFESTYMMGLKRTTYRGVETIHHSGGLFGLNSQMLTMPSLGLDVMIMVNGAPVSSSRLAYQVVDALLSDKLAPTSTSVEIEPYRHLVGARYSDGQGFVVGFDDVNGTLSLAMSNMASAPVLRDDRDRLTLPFEDVGLGPYVWSKTSLAATVDGVAPDQIDVRVSGTARAMVRVRLDPANSPDLSSLAGHFYSRDLKANAKIDLDSGSAELHIRGDYSGWRSFGIEPWSDSVFGIANLHSPDERYVLSIDPSESPPAGFWIDAFRARRLRFDRVPDTISRNLS